MTGIELIHSDPPDLFKGQQAFLFLLLSVVDDILFMICYKDIDIFDLSSQHCDLKKLYMQYGQIIDESSHML